MKNTPLVKIYLCIDFVSVKGLTSKQHTIFIPNWNYYCVAYIILWNMRWLWAHIKQSNRPCMQRGGFSLCTVQVTTGTKLAIAIGHQCAVPALRCEWLQITSSIIHICTYGMEFLPRMFMYSMLLVTPSQPQNDTCSMSAVGGILCLHFDWKHHFMAIWKKYYFMKMWERKICWTSTNEKQYGSIDDVW